MCIPPFDKDSTPFFEKMQNHINDNGTVIITSHSPKNKFKNNVIDTSIKFIGKNKYINNYFKRVADIGLQN